MLRKQHWRSASAQSSRRRNWAALACVVVGSLLVSGCGIESTTTQDATLEFLAASPMGNATLSFAAPVEVSGTPGSTAFTQSQTILRIEWLIEADQMEQAAAELLAQAMAAGWEVEPVDLFGRCLLYTSDAADE